MNSYSVGQQLAVAAVDFDPFAGGEILLTALATESQKEIWASVRMGDDANCAYNESQILRLHGTLNIEALQVALQELVGRHESLRMTFSPDGTTLCINVNQLLAVPLVDLSGWNEQERSVQLDQLLREEVKQPFDLEHGPLFRVQLLRLSAGEHWLLMTAHHIICDGWSWSVLIPDLGKIYSALVQGEMPELEAADRFSDYALTLEENAGSEEAVATEAFWLEQFSQSIPVLDFPTDRPRPAVRTFDAAREDWTLPSSLVTALKQLGTAAGCSFMTTMLASFEVFLHRLTGQDDIVVGVPAAGQAASGHYNLVGHCVNLLPLRTTVEGQLRFSDYLKQRQSTVLNAYDHQQFTFGNLVRKLSIPRDSSRIPLVPIAFNIDQGLTGDQLPYAGLEVEFCSNPRAYENFELFINATELNGEVTLECQYNTNLFDPKTIHRRLAEFETLLTAIAANPNQTIAILPLLPEAEWQLLQAWNQTQTAYPSQSTVHELFEAQVEQSPNAVAVIFAERLGDVEHYQQLTYQELNQRSNQLAHYLQRLGVGPETRIGIYMNRSLDVIVGILGALKAGGAYVPLDPAYPAERINFMLQDTQVQIVLTQQSLAQKLPQTTPVKVCLDADWQNIVQESSSNLSKNTTADSLLYIMYTSGSTGKPKGVCIPHRGAVRLVKGNDYTSFSSDEVFLQLAPLAFDASTLEIWGALLNGARVVIFPGDQPSMDELAYVIQQYHITTLWLTAGLFHLMVDENLEALKPLRYLLAGGDVLSVPHVKKFRQQAKECRLINGYGPTENTTFTCCYPIPEPEAIGLSVPIGCPIANTQIYILDRYGQPAPIGIPGELHIGGDGLAHGYWNRPELTEAKFVPNPLSDGPERLYKTGDMVRLLPDGIVEFLGRIDQQVKIRGFRIELGEVEAALNQYPAVQSCVVVAHKKAPADERLIAYVVQNVVQNQGRSATTAELRNYLKQQLPNYMIPTNFVVLDSLPLTANGKVDRKALPELDVVRDLTESYVAPRTPTEQQVVEIWQQILQLERVGIYDNFFDLGGHSLVATQVLSRLRQKLGVDLPLRTFFEVPMVADLAERVETVCWLMKATSEPSSDTTSSYDEGEL
ncbi:amino acid adenylation domain-containing protein [Leptolyngbya sp. NK1-12]|uniref:Amino acid adenylation domain-containing protein n=1 Tax=Leptolyngbya sp. NK1-12 TaxID=2547451 RepID=A0AA96WR25_9CYAN|nr:amino acid adenylation domain-containing protein [Leptolyngbya sp. NK1-12]WNZ27671.1 amino acid adenylation domain-containing protein [Leptolyngbya sp. NK1-12]